MRKRTLFLAVLAAFVAGGLVTWQAARLIPEDGVDRWNAKNQCSRIHKPTLEEYGTHYRGDPGYPMFSWWYSGFLSSSDGHTFMFRLSMFPPHSSHYPGGALDVVQVDFSDRGTTRESPAYRVSWKFDEIHFDETPDQVVATVPGTPGFVVTVTPVSHRISVSTPAFSCDLELEGMDPVFFWNEGNPVAMPNSHNLMIGFEDFMSASGTLRHGEKPFEVVGDIVNERIFFDGDKWGWYEEDWLALTHPAFYCLLFQVKFRVDEQERDYKEGFLYLREEDAYIPLTDLSIVHRRTGPGAIEGQPVAVPSEIAIRAANRELLMTGLLQSVGRSGREIAFQGDVLIQVRQFEHAYSEVMGWDEVMRNGI